MVGVNKLTRRNQEDNKTMQDEYLCIMPGTNKIQLLLFVFQEQILHMNSLDIFNILREFRYCHNWSMFK